MEFKNYDINIRIDDSNDTFSGHEKIQLNAANEEVVLNSVDLDVSSVKVNGSNAEFNILKEEEELRIKGTRNGDIELEIDFSGSIKDILMGLYVSKTSSGKFYTTQFESSGARRAFPCLDNPGYKAEFSLTLEINRELDAISNMPVSSESISGDLKKVVFGKTPMMSTYLLYIGVGKFDEKSEKYRDMKILLSAPRGHLGEVELPFQFAKESIKHYEEYFGIKYALPKMHLISVPDFGAGAMENWGAITFREVLLNVSTSTSVMVKRIIAEVIAHEIAHQWFGNLVTMKWWNDLWLNESFATFMSYKTIDRFHKEWDMWGLFLLSETSGALTGDSLRGSHPIDVEVKSPNDVAQIFDEISYGKGGSILRMIESFVGEENFRDGIRKYLKDHQYGNAVGEDLWKSIEEVSKQPVGEIMNAWIRKQGYPVVTVRKEGSEIHLEQRRFLVSGDQTEDLWPVPLTVRTKDGVNSILLKDRTRRIKDEGFIKLNADQAGFYRVNYSDDLFDNIMKQYSSLTELDKWGIASDLFSMLTSGKIGIEDYMKRISGFSEDSSPLLAELISGQFLTLHLIMPENSHLNDVAEKYVGSQLERIGDKKEDEEDRISILRGALADVYAHLSRDYADRLSKRFSGYSSEDPDMRGAVATAYALRRNDLDGLVSVLKETSSDEDRIKIIGALGWLKTESGLSNVMKLIDDGTIRKQDMIHFFMAAGMNPDGRKFMLDNYDTMVGEMLKYFVGTGYASTIIERTLPYLGLTDYDRSRKTAENARQPETEKGIEKGLELLEVYNRLRKSAGF